MIAKHRRPRHPPPFHRAEEGVEVRGGVASDEVVGSQLVAQEHDKVWEGEEGGGRRVEGGGWVYT